jgi:flagellar biosynthesis protein FlhF
MQVKKFEAKSIKEAIDLVKFHLGPDAIILSAKENTKGFGLVGESSVEVTAAVSEQTLRKKQYAEQKLDSKSKERFLRATANKQKQFINKIYDQDRLESENAEKTEKRDDGPAEPKQNGITARRYADIDSEGQVVVSPNDYDGPRASSTSAARPSSANQASRPPTGTVPAPMLGPVRSVEQKSAAGERIATLESEVNYLKSLLDRFQNMPQGFVSLHPGAEEGLPYELSFAFKKLADAGISHENTVDILKRANQLLPNEQKKKRAFVDGWIIKYLLDRIQVVDKPFRKKFQIFLGPTGQGKTSMVVKLACQLIMKEKKKVALISGDNVKVGASDQFKIYAQILNAPYAVINGPADWQTLMPQLANVDYVFVDSPGVNLKNPTDLDTIKNILPPNSKDADIHFVQSIMARDTDAFEIADRFRIIGFNDVIFTRLDEAVQHGLIYNFQKKFEVPLHSFGIGNSVPDDFEFSSKERVIDLIFNLSHFRKERGQS